MTTISQVCASDATTLDNVPDRNFANEVLLSVMSGSDFRLTYMYFNQPFPPKTTIVSATLRLHQRGVRTGGTRTVTVRNLARKWNESTITSTNRPGFVAGTSASVTKGNGGVDGDVWEFDVTALLQLVSDGAPWYGFRVEGNIASLQYFYARQSAVFGATLDIEWSDSPDRPTVLAPANGRAVSIARPTVRWDFTDPSGDTTMSAYRLLMNVGGPDEISPDYDSGDVPANIPEHLMTFDIDYADDLWWAVENVDGAGIRSGLSEWTNFTRTAKPTVTITNPAASPDNFVSESTPPYSWTAPGQVAYQLFITKPGDPTEVIWTSGKVTSADLAVTPPNVAASLLIPGNAYDDVTRIWDGVARESTPGDPIYTDAVRTFTFDLSTDTDPVDSITVTASSPRPGLDVGFVMSTAPDSLTILRRVVGADNWTVIAANLAAVDYLLGGTTYNYPDSSAPPRVDVEYSVVRVDNGISSDDNPSDHAMADPTGIWLSTLDGSVSLCITGAGGFSFQASEDSAVHYPLGATNPILITQAIHGRVGSVAGFLQGKQPGLEDVSLADWSSAFAALRNPPGQVLNLTLTDTSTRVFIYNALVEPGDEFHGEIPVSFDFCELL